jgi:type I restriction enzyme S subunit
MKRWPIMRLGDLVRSAQQRDPRENPGEEFCYVDIAGVDNEAKTIVVTQRIVGADAPSRARKVVRRGDVIVSTVRPNLNAVALVPDNLDNQICSTGFSVLSPSSKVTSGYLFAFVRSPSFIDRLVARTTGANYPAVNDGEVKDVPIPVPPLAEQERIVKLLDEADELRKLRAQADRRTADLIPAFFHDMFGDPKHSWRSSALGELVQDFRYGTSNKSTGEGKPTLRIPNVIQEAVNLDDLKFVPVSDSEFERLRLKDGDLLFVRTNGNAHNVGRCAVFDAQAIKAAGYNAEEFIYASYLIRARLQPERVTPLFVQHFLACPEGCRALRARSKTSAGQFNINTEGLGTILIPLPPLPLQNEFAARVTEIRAVQAEQATSRRRLDDLFQSMLHRAFNGEL